MGQKGNGSTELPYGLILAAMDGGAYANDIIVAATSLAKTEGRSLIGCHVYAAQMHTNRFLDMEPGLPPRYKEEARLTDLRKTHDSLIDDGMKVISDAFLAPLVERSKKMGITCLQETPEGRNYTGILRLARERETDLVVIGAAGFEVAKPGILGSVAERVLLYNRPASDILLIKSSWGFEDRPVVVGIDGSQEGYAALQRAVFFSRFFGARLIAVSVYDPYFHSGVFHRIADALSPEAKARFRFEDQERLHDEIINDGLMHLYREGLARAGVFAESMGVMLGTEVLTGKVYSEVVRYAAEHNAGLVIVGRHGLHHSDESLIGSNTLNIARFAGTNILIVAAPTTSVQLPPALGEEAPAIPWTPEAEALLSRMPPFAAPVARKAITLYARSAGYTEVTPAIMREVSGRRGEQPRHSKKDDRTSIYQRFTQ